MNSKEFIPSTCQYWVEEHFCIHWSRSSLLCTYSGVNVEDTPSQFPICNFVGSAITCSKFKEDVSVYKPTFRCILPDPYRYIYSYKSSSKWAFYIKSQNDEGNYRYVQNTSLITGYTDNGFTCVYEGVSVREGEEEQGNNIKCSGYSPQHLGYGIIFPDDKEITDASKFNFRLPLNYEVLSVRSRLSTCYWWQGDVKPYELTSILEEDKPYKEIQNPIYIVSSEEEIPTKEDFYEYPRIKLVDDIVFIENKFVPGKCIRGDTEDYLKASYTNIPCNGSHDKCPYYTGICWQYVQHDRLLTGEQVISEQILELRYYYYETYWDVTLYNTFFIEPILISWLGEISYIYNNTKEPFDLEVDIEAVATSLNFSVDILQIDYQVDTLKAGTEVKPNNVGQRSDNFTTLVREVTSLLLSPVLLTYLDYYKEALLYESRSVYSAEVLLYGTQHTYFYDSVCVDIDALKEHPYFLNLLVQYKDTNNLYIYTYNVPADPSECFGYSNFEQIQQDIDLFIKDCRLKQGDYLYENELAPDSKAFIFRLKQSYKQKRYLILTKYSNLESGMFYWGYTFFELLTSYVGGFLKQTSFYLNKEVPPKGKRALVDRVYDYRMGFSGFDQELKVSYVSYISKSTGYESMPGDRYYNAYKSTDLLKSITYIGYETYICEKSFNLKIPNLVQLGSGGYVAVKLDDYNLDKNGNVILDEIHITSIYGIPEISEKDDELYLIYPEGTEDNFKLVYCPMELVYFGSKDGLPENICILKPKNLDKFKSICKDTELYIKYIKVKIKRSAGATMPESGDTLWHIYLEESEDDLNQLVVLPGSREISYNSSLQEFSITNLKSTLTLAVPLKDSKGRYINVVKLKVAVWIKQPLVPDVEMDYSWTAEYGLYQNFPMCRCCGTYYRTLLRTTSLSSKPECGDHEVSPSTGVGKMWYPYVQCASFSRYNMINNQIYGDIMGVKGLYKEKDASGKRVHGSWDMRMEGPIINHIKTGLYCCDICPCSCQVETFNIIRLGASYFSGFGRYRGAVGQELLMAWLASGGGLPRFGNVLRPQLKSYRSTDYVQHLYYDVTSNPPTYKTRWFWMPSKMHFSDLAYYEREDVLYEEYLDDDATGFIDSMGTFLFNFVDNYTFNEFILKERLRFEDIFEVFTAIESIAYPKSVMNMDGDRLPIPQYKIYKGLTIQWAWRDIYKDIERSEEERLNFLTINKPSYKFDRYNKEHRLICDEGEHSLKFISPEMDSETGLYRGFPKIQLDNGLKRCFDWQGNLDPYCANEDEDYSAKYKKLTEQPWELMGLFDSDYVETTEEADDADRKIVLSNMLGDVTTYYNRGILIDSLIVNTSDSVPTEYQLLDGDHEYTIFFDEKMPIEMLGQQIQGTMLFNSNKSIAKFKFIFKYGSEYIEEDNIYNVYCVPDIYIQTFCYQKGKIPKNVSLREEVVELEYLIPIEYLVTRSTELSFTFDCTPPLDDNGNIKYPCDIIPNNMVKKPAFKYVISLDLESIEVSDLILKDLKEIIFVHERKYYVAVTNSKVTPPHGKNLSNWVLKPRFDKIELDTVWQRDKDGAVVGLPNSSGKVSYVHRTRSRFLLKTVVDAKVIEGDVHDKEKVQAQLYNKVTKLASDNISIKSILYPDLKFFTDCQNVYIKDVSSTVSFINKAIYPVGNVAPYPKMEAQGHLLLPSPPWHEYCGYSLVGGSGCHGDDTFVYSRYNMDDGGRVTSAYGGLDIFYSGTKFMIQRLKIARFVATRMSAQYEVSAKGKVFIEGDYLDSLLIPAYKPMPGLYAPALDTYYPRRRHDSWPRILPGLWPRLGNINDYV